MNKIHNIHIVDEAKDKLIFYLHTHIYIYIYISKDYNNLISHYIQYYINNRVY